MRDGGVGRVLEILAPAEVAEQVIYVPVVAQQKRPEIRACTASGIALERLKVSDGSMDQGNVQLIKK